MQPAPSLNFRPRYIDNVPPIILTLIVHNSTGNLPILILSQQEVVTYAHHSEIKTK